MKKFIKKLKNWENNFEVKDYEYTKYHCEIAQIYQESANGHHTQECLETWKDIYSKEYFELHHPVYNHIQTRVIANFLHPNFHLNYIFFADKSMKYLWLSLQIHGICDCFITQEAVYLMPVPVIQFWRNSVLGRIKQVLPLIGNTKIYYQDIPFNICFDNIRPFHFFGDDIFWFLKLQPKKDILKKQAFWLPKTLQTSETFNKDSVYIAPRIHFNSNFDFISPQVIEDSLQDFNSLVHPQDKLDRFDKEEITMQDLKNLIAMQEQRETL